MQTWLITGGAGFLGANLIRYARERGLARIVNLDSLVHGGRADNLAALKGDGDHEFVQAEIGDQARVGELLMRHRPDAVINLAAVTDYTQTVNRPDLLAGNSNGTLALLQAVIGYWRKLRPAEQKTFRFMQVSSGEIYGSVDPYDPAFTEDSIVRPSTLRAAACAAGDHFALSFGKTHGLPVVVARPCQAFGPYQHASKLIPTLIARARRRQALPIFGDGKYVRDWLHVNDHCTALHTILDRGRPGETYNISAGCERTTLEVAGAVCRLFDEIVPGPIPHIRLVTHVADRVPHDRRSALDSRKLREELFWQPAVSFEDGLAHTVRWYVENSPVVTVDPQADEPRAETPHYEPRGALRG